MALDQTRFTLLGLNPNDVAACITVLILSLPVFLKWSRHLIWLVWPLETALIALLVGTGSRGGILALICALIFTGFLSWRIDFGAKKWKIWACLGLATVIGVGVGLAAFPKGFRIGTVGVSPETSAGRRLEVWSTVPAMLAAAPNGWGLGNSAEAYEQWFEPIGETVELRHLLSSHLTWLVEIGWPLRWLYAFLWMTAIALLIPSQNFRFPIWGMAVWTAFLVALFYNAVGKWWNWPVPVIWLLAVVIARWRQKVFPSKLQWMVFAFISCLFVGLPFVIFGSDASPVLIRSWDGGNIVLIGTGKPTVAILAPDKEVIGDFYGHEIRREWGKGGVGKGSVVVIGRPDASSSRYLADCRLYVISGGDETALYKWRLNFTPKFDAKLLLINCRVPVDDWIKVFSRVVYCHGEFYGDSHYNEWEDFSTASPAVLVKDVPRHEAYIADWWSLLDDATVK